MLVERIVHKNKNEQSKLALTISAQYGLVDQETFFNKKVASSDLSHYYLLTNGDFAYNKSYSTGYPWGAVKRLDLYEQGAVSTLYICFKPKDALQSDFATHYFESNKWHKGVSDIAVEGARNHGLLNISVSDYFNTEHYIPTYQEQCKMADFLNIIDERISTQIGLIEDLKKLKSAITDKLFGGEKGEKVRLGDVGSFIRGLTYSTDDVSEKPNGAIVVRANNLIDGEEINTTVDIVRVHKEVPNNMILKRGDIAICMANGSTKLIGKNSFYNGTSKCPITVGTFCGIYRSSLSYVRWLLQTTRYKRYVYQSLQGGNGAIANLNGMDILNMKFFVPTKEICNNIIPLLQSVETKIQDEQSLLILNENLKAYLLRMMFI